MKKYLITTILLLAFTIGVGAAPQTDSVDETGLATQASAIEAFSDTTDTATAHFTASAQTNTVFDDPDDMFDQTIRKLFSIQGEAVQGMLFIIIVLSILFIIAPIAILALLFYFIYKNRKQRLQFAEQAMKNGQSIPNEFVNAQPSATDNDLRTKGIRQLFLGIGLMILLGNVAGNIGLGIGALIACIGLGNLVVSRSDHSKDPLNDNNNHKEQNIKYYD